MKILVWVFLLAFTMSGCLRKRYFIEHDYKYSLGFNDYKTYGFVDCPRDTNVICDDVQEAIRQQMNARGYKMAKGVPDLFVNFFIYYDEFKYRGYDQPSIHYFLSGNSNETYKPITYKLKQGTIMVSLIESQTAEVVWRGYATGVFNSDSYKKSYFKNVIANVFTQYPLFASDAAWKRSRINKTI